jgi:demethylmenaquinone methyltransferase/2-methoxy-6-polyprenyl-1,4-benzoquinol methylase
MSVFFGLDIVDIQEKTKRVKDLFSRVSGHYDVMNDLMSLGLHRHWKRAFVRELPVALNHYILDVATGTGDIARQIIREFRAFNVSCVGVDLTPAMLEEGRKKTIDEGILSGIEWCGANAEQLPFADETFNGYVITFGLRNVADREKALREAYRVLKPEGWICCMEFSRVYSAGLEKAYNFYSKEIIPLLGKYVAKDYEAYQYLVDSIKTFPDQNELAQEFEEAGFSSVRFSNRLGGIVATHYGTKKV